MGLESIMDDYEASMTLIVASIILQDFGDKRARQVWQRFEKLSESEQKRLSDALTPMMAAIIQAVNVVEKLRTERESKTEVKG